jgi:ketosteroid isomerase-like protein
MSAAAALPLALVGATAPTGRFNAPADVAAIKAIEQKLQSELDMDKVMSFYAPDATVLDIYAPGIYRGADQIRAGFGPQLAAVDTLTPDFREINVATDGKFACAAMQIQFKTVLKGGKPLSMALREIDAFKKIDGQWKVVQQHVSLPVDQKTGMAVLDGPVVGAAPMMWSAHPLPGPATTPAQAKRELRAFMDVGGVSTSLAQLMRYYGPGDDVSVYDNFYPGILRGRKQISDHYAGMMGAMRSSSMTMPLFVADSDGSFGIQANTQELKVTLKDGSVHHIAIRQSDCLRRVGGKWYSFFEMISNPIDVKTGKALLEHGA